MNATDLNEILRKHKLWLDGDSCGECADLRDADLRDADLGYADLRDADLRDADLRDADLGYADLRDADLRDADLRDANLGYANLSYADLRDADLRDANLSYADLRDAYLGYADLRDADLSCANLRDADLRGADLRDADLSCANLSYAELICVGNMREIKSLQIDKWPIAYTSEDMQIGCQKHAIEKWRKWDTPAGRKWVSAMDEDAAAWADKHLALVLQFIDASPATPTGETK